MTYFKFQKLGLAVSIGLASTCLAAMPAAAQASNMQEMVEKADANGDGDISWSEIEAARLEVFQRVDRNGDGVVNTADRPPRAFAGRFDQALERLQTDFDSDRDGQITEAEMLAAPAPIFEQGDTDENGVLTADEMAALNTRSKTL
ncbi:MAG: hypothetical protein AAFP81_19860 [Pseudomonadota bacterium]